MYQWWPRELLSKHPVTRLPSAIVILGEVHAGHIVLIRSEFPASEIPKILIFHAFRINWTSYPLFLRQLFRSFIVVFEFWPRDRESGLLGRGNLIDEKINSFFFAMKTKLHLFKLIRIIFEMRCELWLFSGSEIWSVTINLNSRFETRWHLVSEVDRIFIVELILIKFHRKGSNRNFFRMDRN